MRLRPLVLASMLVCLTPTIGRAGEAAGVDADAALAALRDGNARFVAGESTFPNLTEARRCETTEGGQHPIASILSCADSRVPPELIFDAGLGDLFVIRVAGNVAANDEVGTVEYGAGHLGTRLIVVMGHSKCGAVTAVVKHAAVSPNIARLVAPIAPAVDEARAANPTAAEQRLINLSIRANVRRAMHDLLGQSAEVRELVAAGKVKLIGAIYDIHNGTVEWIGEHPEQAALLKVEGDEHASAAAKEETAKPDAGHGARLVSQKVAPAAAHAEPAARAAVSHEPGASAHDAHAAEPAKPASPAHGKPSKAEPPHGAAPHEKPSPAEPAHGEPHAASEAGHHDSHAADKPASGDDAHAVAGPTLMQRQGLLLPAAFMAAGSALSGTIVYAMTGRAKAATPQPVSH